MSLDKRDTNHRIVYWEEERGWTFGYRCPDQRIRGFYTSKSEVIFAIRVYALSEYTGIFPIIYKRSGLQYTDWRLAKTTMPILKPRILTLRRGDRRVYNHNLQFTDMDGLRRSITFWTKASALYTLCSYYKRRMVAWSLVVGFHTPSLPELEIIECDTNQRSPKSEEE